MRAPLAAARHDSSRARSPTWFSTPAVAWYHSSSGFTSTARTLVWPRCTKARTRWPPMNPPAPVTTTRSFLDIDEPFTLRLLHPVFNDLPVGASPPPRTHSTSREPAKCIGPAGPGPRCRWVDPLLTITTPQSSSLLCPPSASSGSSGCRGGVVGGDHHAYGTWPRSLAPVALGWHTCVHRLPFPIGVSSRPAAGDIGLACRFRVVTCAEATAIATPVT